MMINTLVENDATGEMQALQSCLIWDKDTSELDNYRLLIHYTMVKNQLGRAKALALFRELKGECLLRYMLGDIEACALMDFRPPLNDLVAPEAFDYLRGLRHSERALILAALSEKKSLAELTELTWIEVKLNTWAPLTVKIFNAMVRRLGCSYVFWVEDSLSKPTPCYGLEEDIKQRFDVTWTEFAGVVEGLLVHQHFANPQIEALLTH